MDEEKYQKELFPLEHKPKRLFPRLSDLFPKADFERNVVLTLTLDRAVFIAIGIIMIMVVTYAVGIEAGKRRVEAVVPAAAPVPAVAPVKAMPLPVRPQAPAVIAPAAAKPYTIVIGTFSKKDFAIQEMAKLSKRGFNAFISQSGNYYQVSVGAYANKASADIQRDLKNVGRLYKGAYIKLR